MRSFLKLLSFFAKSVLALMVGAAFVATAQADLVAYFPLNDGADGTTASVIDDIIDDGSHPVTDGTPNTMSATWVDDAVRGIVLNSPDDNRFLAGSQGIDLTKGFTWSLWAKVTAATPASRVIIGTRNGTWHKITPGSGVDGTGLVDFVSGAYNLADDTWHHIGYVGTDNGTGNPGTVDVSLYIDGVFIGKDTTAAALTYDGQMEIGGSTRFSEYADVRLDDVAIWDHALSVAEIQALAAGGPVVPDADPFAITEFSYEPDTDSVTLTWRSRPGELYTVKYSNDMTNWDADLDDDIPAATEGDTTTRTFVLNSPDPADSLHLFFRVERL